MHNPDELCPGGGYIIADSAYGLSPWLITPYPHDTTDVCERNFNYILSSMRMVIERAYGKLKGRWRILADGVMSSSYRRCVRIVHVCCILHVLCIDNGDILPEEEALNTGQFDGGNGHGQETSEEVLKQLGKSKREYLKNVAWQLRQ